MVSKDLAELLRSFPDDELLLIPDDVDAEARNNMTAYGFDPARFDLVPVAHALSTVGERLRERFADAPGPVTFYAWYDEQAGQLRCSVASAQPAELPFRGLFRPVDRPEEVLDRMAADRHPGFVIWDGLRNATEIPDEPVEYRFPVFAVQVKTP
ncbi:hypothetical protein DPM19_22700 [Actinomadura craniellae]|uniref:Uncharacterized protein n=1 Tax=Actinomadura craniellae TaxID=2231787 RepID=A0A365H167_9ACTN|nr:hypothetical protein [Actinomadura craniellae]RAY12832.1 hypothetical protein DPM19_22700 [Actinomadura craniellae]